MPGKLANGLLKKNLLHLDIVARKREGGGELAFIVSLCPQAPNYVLPHISSSGAEGKNNSKLLTTLK